MKQSKQSKLIGALRLCVARLEEYDDAEGGIALEGARRVLHEVAPPTSPAPKREVTINAEQKLFVIPSGDSSYSCFGFDNCYRDACHLASLLGAEPPLWSEYGTLAQYEAYRKLCTAYAARPDLNRQTWFTPGTPAEVQKVLEEVRQSGARVRLFLGDPASGKPWLEEHEVVGTIGRSTGPQRVPLLIPSARSTGGCAILTDCVVCVIDTRSGRRLYQHPGFAFPSFQSRTGKVRGHELELWRDGECVACFADEKARAAYVAFHRGQRFTL